VPLQCVATGQFEAARDEAGRIGTDCGAEWQDRGVREPSSGDGVSRSHCRGEKKNQRSRSTVPDGGELGGKWKTWEILRPEELRHA
jgi:hypothetical protein